MTVRRINQLELQGSAPDVKALLSASQNEGLDERSECINLLCCRIFYYFKKYKCRFFIYISDKRISLTLF